MARVGDSWSVTVNVHGGDYAIPDNVRVQEMRVTGAGSVVMQRYDGTTRDFVGTTFDIYKLGEEGWKSVRQVGTTAALRANAIRLNGYYVSA